MKTSPILDITDGHAVNYHVLQFEKGWEVEIYHNPNEPEHDHINCVMFNGDLVDYELHGTPYNVEGYVEQEFDAIIELL